MFNVAYDAPDGVHLYQAVWTTKAIAENSCEYFRKKYVGQPCPFRKGWYPFRNPRVVKRVTPKD